MSSNYGMNDLGQLLASVQDEVRAVKEHIDSLPIFPKGNTLIIYLDRTIPNTDSEVTVAIIKI